MQGRNVSAHTVTRIRCAIATAFVLGAIGVYLVPVVLSGARDGVLTVVFFDVGQGDAVFIESPTGTQVLIDGGPDAGVLRELSAVLGFFDRSLDLVVATHLDADHVGGLPDVFDRYEVAAVLLTENRGESTAADAFLRRVQREGAERITARRGMTFALGGGAELTVLFPDRDPSMLESNTASVVAQLTYGEHEFLLTGDAPASIEEYLVLIDGTALASEVLKVGHHGSQTSSSELFVDTVRPEYAVISAGADNRYGHPHASVLETFSEAGAIVKNTAGDGSVTFVSDGVTLELK